ncbi:MAG: DNA polymerase III subunit delta [Calditrichia bacterium]
MAGRRIYYQQAIREIGAGKIEPAYFLYGEETLLADNLIQRLRQEFIGEIDRELNYFVRYATESGLDAVFNLGAGMGLFSDKKMVILREAQVLKKEEVKKLIHFLDRMEKNICLILHGNITSTYNTRLKPLEDHIKSVHLLPLRQNEIKDFIVTEFKKFGKETVPDAIDMLHFLVGNQLTDLRTQIATISHYHEDKELIEVADIEKIAGVYVTQDIFEYNRLLAERMPEKALFLLHHLLESGVSGQQFISQLLRHFSIMWCIQGFQRSGTYKRDLAMKTLAIYPKYFSQYETQSKNWQKEEIEKVFYWLYDAEKSLKSAHSDPKIALDILTYRVINC